MSCSTGNKVHSEVVGWEYEKSFAAREYVSWSKRDYVAPERFCKKKVFLLILVFTTFMNLEQQRAIRETWGANKNVNGYDVDYYFLLGNNKLEFKDFIDEKHNDVIIDFEYYDTNLNESFKAISMLKLLRNHCIKSARFIMKATDETYLNLPVIINFLATRIPYKYLAGKVEISTGPVRNCRLKKYVPDYMYEPDGYPTYFENYAYIFTPDLVLPILNASFAVKFLYLEHIFITGICADYIRITRRNIIDFSCWDKQCLIHPHLTPDWMYTFHKNYTANLTYDYKQ